jgi:hypothetical protein
MRVFVYIIVVRITILPGELAIREQEPLMKAMVLRKTMYQNWKLEMTLSMGVIRTETRR